MSEVLVVGAGLAGCEAAWRLAQHGIPVALCEMKPAEKSPAHRMDGFAELVCSNSLKADRLATASGLLKAEMRSLGSLCLDAAVSCAVPAGGALAVNRENFSRIITEKIRSHPHISVREERVDALPRKGLVILATGPLTDGALADDLQAVCGRRALSFYDAVAPIVTAESVDLGYAFWGSRYGRGGDDYLNCPMDRGEYELFVRELLAAQTAELRDFDVPLVVYEGCMPVEVLASRGTDSLRFGPFKPRGFIDPATGKWPWALLQLRREDAGGSLLGLVGCQTHLRFGEQKRVFSVIPALRDAEFVRYGVMHRNSFLCAPEVLAPDLSLRALPNVFVAGQLTGVEGYMESAAMGILTAVQLERRMRGSPPLALPRETMLGGLCAHLAEGDGWRFQPMGANFGLLPPLPARIRGKQERYEALSARALPKLREILDVEAR